MQNSKKAGESVGFPGLPTARVHPVPPSVANFREILMRAVETGRLHASGHFVERCYTRGFSTLDAEILIESGSLTEGPTYDPERHTFRCELQGSIDGKGWKLVVALDCDSDFCKSPRLVLVTVHRRDGRRSQNK